MISKRMKNAVSVALSMAVVAGAAAPISASASGTRTKAEKFGEDTYANRFLSLYDDVVTNGQENGYLSSSNVASGGFGIPYHAVETMIVEAPDYGHETTSEAMSYLVWIAAMRDHLAENVDPSNDLVKAWKTMEYMIPDEQKGFMTGSEPSATYSPELDTIEAYATNEAAMLSGNNAINPLWSKFTSAYSSDSGLYLMHWLADVDNWYGYGNGTNFTLINTFQRGAMESCWETVPHPCVEELKYGNSKQGIKGIFKAPNELEIAAQWSYTNAPDAEDRAIQAVYAANRWGVGDSSVTTLAGKMGDELRNNMFDKYYKKIAVDTNEWSPSTGYESAHYLRNWYTSWGGALDGSWKWQIGCSHCHEFYQNPLAAYALLADSDLKSAMKAENAVKDYETSLARQLEFYLWLQASNGPIAGGATNSNRGRYAPYTDGILNEDGTTKNVSSTFYDMLYVEHPVYLDPGSNHWIGNQVWALQRLAELYYYVKTDGDQSGVTLSDGTTVEAALERILDKWVEWAVNEAVKLNDDGTYEIAASLDWSGEPDTWTGSASDNSGLTAEITAWGSADMGCVASMANTFIYYAAAKGVDGQAAVSGTDTSTAAKALYSGKELLDRMWSNYRDDIGVAKADTNENFVRLFEQEVVIPSYYTGTMPNGDEIKTGIKFIDIRTKYKDDPRYAELEADYNDNGKTDTTEFTYHRFWHQGDILMALGAMAEVYPELTPEDEETPEETTTADVTTTADTTTTTDTTTVDDTTATDTTTTAGDISNILWGDVNDDGVVDVRDVTCLKKYIVKLITDDDITAQGKLNGDVIPSGTLDVQDLGQIIKYIIKVVEDLDPAKNGY
jgi:hypothetical protein